MLLKKQLLTNCTPYFLVLASLVILLGAEANADGASSSKKSQQMPILPLEQIINEATEHNALLQAANAEVISAQSKIKPSGALPDPALEGRLTNYPTDSFSPRDSSMTGNEVMLVQKFPFPGKRSHLTEMASHESEASENDAQQTKLALIQRIKTSYQELALATQKEQLLNDQSKLIGDIESIARRKYTLGTAAQAEVLELQLQAAAILVKLEDVRKTVSAKKAELNHLAGRETHFTEWQPSPLKATQIDLGAIDSHNDNEALKDNPSINALKSRAAAASANTAYTNLNIYPDIEVGVGYMQRFNNREDNGQDFASARVGITLPLWQRSKQDEEQKGARAEQKKREALLREGQMELNHSLHEAIADIRATENKIKIYREKLLPLSEAAISSGQKSYETDQSSYLSVLNLIQARFQAQSEYFDAIAEHESAIASLEAVLGKPIATLKPSKS